jgi:hypothetical protein
VIRRLLIIVVIFLVVAVVVLDRVGALIAAPVLASKLQSDEHLPSRPSVSIHGIPFLTQVFGGDYHHVSVTAHDVPVDQVPVTTLKVVLHDVHVPFSKVVHSSVKQVPVDRVTGSAFVSFDDANTYLANHSPVGSLIRLVSGSGDTVDVTDQVKVAGRLLTLNGIATINVQRNVVGVRVTKLSGAPQRIVSTLVTGLGVTLPLQGLPFRIVLASVSVSSAGITATGGATDVVLGS